MTIYIVPNSSKPEAVTLAALAARILLEEKAMVLLAPEFSTIKQNCPGVKFIAQQDAYSLCDIVLTIGGDGTMLHTARDMMLAQKPLIGINMGQLGFLTIIEHNELDKLRRLAHNEYTVEHRSVLTAQFCQGENASCLALNDIVLFKQQPEKTIALDIYCDDTKVSSFRGDGVIFSTPTGSTAYSLSAGGPILDAQLGGIIVTPICAHIVHTPPMVFSSQRVMRAVPSSSHIEEISISCDGMGSTTVPNDNNGIIIRQSDISVPLIQFHDADQLQAIDKKLKGR